MEQILLTRAVPQDAPQIDRITKESFSLYAKEVNSDAPIAALNESIQDIIGDITNKYVYIAKIDGRIVGCVRFQLLSDEIAYLSRFAMQPDIQNLGLGGLLLEKVRLECLNLGVKTILLHTASKMRSTVSFYLKNGYYVHSISPDRGYIRALMVNELYPVNEYIDYEKMIEDLQVNKT